RSHSVEPWSSLRDHPNHTSHQRSPTRRARSPQRRTRPSPRRRLEEDLEKRVYRIHPSDRAATSTLSVMKGFAKARGNLRRRLHLHRISVGRAHNLLSPRAPRLEVALVEPAGVHRDRQLASVNCVACRSIAPRESARAPILLRSHLRAFPTQSWSSL